VIPQEFDYIGISLHRPSILIRCRRYPTLLDRYLKSTQDRFRNFIEESLERLEARGEFTTGKIAEATPSQMPSITERLSTAKGKVTGSAPSWDPPSNQPRRESISVENLAARMERLRHTTSRNA